MSMLRIANVLAAVACFAPAAMAGPVADFSRTVIDGMWAQHNTSNTNTQLVMLTNVGTDALVVDFVVVQESGWTLSGSCRGGLALAPNERCSIVVRYDQGVKNVTEVDVGTNAPGSPDTLTFKGYIATLIQAPQSFPRFTPPYLDFGVQTPGVPTPPMQIT